MNKTSHNKIGRPRKESRVFHLKLDKQYAKRLERYCKFEGRTYTSAVELALDEYLKKRMP